MQPPCAPEISHRTVVHDIERSDPYFWLRERSNPEVIAYLEEENRYTEAMMEPTARLRETLYVELVSRIKETDLSVPEKIGDYYYYSRTEQGRQYPIFCRKKGSLEAEEMVLLDQNALAAGHDYFSLGALQVSPDHRLLAFTSDTNGSEIYSLRFKDLETGEALADGIDNVLGYSVAWAEDNRTIFYVTLDSAQRPYRVWRHRLGQPGDTLVFEESDEAFFVDIFKTRSRGYLIIQSESKLTAEAHYLPADSPEASFRCFARRQAGVKYTIDHRGEQFYIVTDQDAKNSKLLITPVEHPEVEHWQELIPHREAVKLDGIDLFADYLVVYERENALRTIQIFDQKTGTSHAVDFPEPVYTYFPARNPEFASSTLRFTYTSLVTPRTVFDYDMASRARTLLKRDEVYHYDPALYTSERLWAMAPDGVRVPVSIVYKKGLAPDGSNPCYLAGYGSYGISIDPVFSSTRLSLLERGFVFAIAHIRGGGELGKAWYEDGKFLKKQNTFSDFIACAEHLIAGGFTRPERLAISGGSAGGLLIAAVLNQRPELFGAAVAKVPFVDVVNTMLDPSIPLTVTEYEGWGNPAQKAFFDYMLSYSPYDNVQAKAYPPLLVTAGLNDPRVAYWEPAKWTAKLRTLKRDANLLLLKTNMGAGHGGPSGRYSALNEIAFEYAFILLALGLSTEPLTSLVG